MPLERNNNNDARCWDASKWCFRWTQIQALIKKDVSSADIRLFVAAGNQRAKYKDEKAKRQTCRVQFIFIYGNKTLFSPAWSSLSKKHETYITQVLSTVLLHTRCLWTQIYANKYIKSHWENTHLYLFLEFCSSIRTVKGCLCTCAPWFNMQR